MNRIDMIIKRKLFYNSSHTDSLVHRGLCELFRETKYEQYFKRYWSVSNVENYTWANSYLDFADIGDHGKALLWRLLIIEDFKLWLGENGVKYE